MTRPAIAITPAIMAPVTSRPGAAPLVRDADGAGVVLVGELLTVKELPVDAGGDCTGVELGLKGVDGEVVIPVVLEGGMKGGTYGPGCCVDDDDDVVVVIVVINVEFEEVRLTVTVVVGKLDAWVSWVAWAICANNGTQTAQSRSRSILPRNIATQFFFPEYCYWFLLFFSNLSNFFPIPQARRLPLKFKRMEKRSEGRGRGLRLRLRLRLRL